MNKLQMVNRTVNNFLNTFRSEKASQKHLKNETKTRQWKSEYLLNFPLVVDHSDIFYSMHADLKYESKKIKVGYIKITAKKFEN